MAECERKFAPGTAPSEELTLLRAQRTSLAQLEKQLENSFQQIESKLQAAGLSSKVKVLAEFRDHYRNRMAARRLPVGGSHGSEPGRPRTSAAGSFRKADDQNRLQNYRMAARRLPVGGSHGSEPGRPRTSAAGSFRKADDQNRLQNYSPGIKPVDQPRSDRFLADPTLALGLLRIPDQKRRHQQGGTDADCRTGHAKVRGHLHNRAK